MFLPIAFLIEGDFCIVVADEAPLTSRGLYKNTLGESVLVPIPYKVAAVNLFRSNRCYC